MKDEGPGTRGHGDAENRRTRRAAECCPRVAVSPCLRVLHLSAFILHPLGCGEVA